MGKIINVEQLVLEITWKCNMSCPHCMRGECQDKGITKEVIDRTLEHIGEIECIVFSGGEPSLNPEAMMYALDACQKKDIPINGFFLATNGKEVSDAFIEAVHAWHRYYLQCICRIEAGNENRTLSGKELMEFVRQTAYRIRMASFDEGNYDFKVSLSADAFHEPIPYRNVQLLMELPSFCADTVRDFTQEAVLNEGKARTLSIPQKKREEHDRDVFYLDFDSNCYKMELAYVNADGLVICSGDLSYEHQADSSIPHYSVFGPDWAEELIRDYAGEGQDGGIAAA